MSARRRTRSEREQLELFRALPGDLAARDAQDLMAYPFFSLETHRITPIDYRMNDISIRVEGVPEHGNILKKPERVTLNQWLGFRRKSHSISTVRATYFTAILCARRTLQIATRFSRARATTKLYF